MDVEGIGLLVDPFTATPTALLASVADRGLVGLAE